VKNDITDIRFIYPADSSYTLSRKDSIWYAGTGKADSSGIAEYLNSLALMNGQEIKDGLNRLQHRFTSCLLKGKLIKIISKLLYR